MTGLEPATSGSTVRCSNQLSYTPGVTSPGTKTGISTTFQSQPSLPDRHVSVEAAARLSIESSGYFTWLSLIGQRFFADSIAACRTRWVMYASWKSGMGTSGFRPPIILNMSPAMLIKPCS